MAAQAGWEQQVLNDLSAPITAANTAFLDAWAQLEEPSPTAGYANNPLNSKQYMTTSGAQAASSQVQDYATQQLGAYETAATISNGYYPAVVQALQSGNPLTSSQNLGAIDQELKTWSGGGYGVSQIASTEGKSVPFSQLWNDWKNGDFGAIGNDISKGVQSPTLGSMGITIPNAAQFFGLTSAQTQYSAVLLVGIGLILAALFLLKE